MIHIYGDDGADAKKERVIAVAVIAGREEWWQSVENQWIVRCGGIPFHATDCEGGHKDYEGVPREDCKAMYRDLTLAALHPARTPAHAILTPLPLHALSSLKPDTIKPFGQDAVYRVLTA